MAGFSLWWREERCFGLAWSLPIRNGAGTMTKHPPGVSQVWQAKRLREGVLGSVASKGLTGEILEVWQRKNLAGFWMGRRIGWRGIGVAARRSREAHGMEKAHMIEAGTPQSCPNCKTIIPQNYYLSRRK